jgi:hypothetical protein
MIENLEDELERIEDPEQERQWVSVIHACLAILAPIVIFLFVGCLQVANPNGETVDYGPEINPQKILDARAASLANSPHSDPYNIKVGEYVHMSETQDVSAGALQSVLSDTGQTITDRQEDNTQVVYTLVEHKVIYATDGTNQKESRESKLGLEKTPSNTPAPTPSPTAVPSASPTPASSPAISSTEPMGTMIASEFNATVKRVFGARPLDRELRWMVESAPERALSDLVRTLTDKTTYHRLRVSNETTSAPALVLARPNCQGIPNCRIRLTHVGYDVVNWTNGVGDRIIVDETVSPDVPYLAETMDRCLTVLVPIQNTTTKALVVQCTPVEDFMFQPDSGN